MGQYIVNSIRFVVTQSIYFIAALFPRTQKAVMGSYKNKFADNSKYLYLHWQQAKTIRSIWISGDKDVIAQLTIQGYEAYYRWSIKGIFHALTAKYYVYNSYIGDVNQYFANGAVKINLWHGSPLKRIEYDINNGPLFSIYHPQSLHQKFVSVTQYHQQRVAPDYMIAPSDLVSALFATAFHINEHHMLLSGNPRTDFYQRYPKSTSIIQTLKQNNNVSQVLLYAPSWRDSGIADDRETRTNPYLQAINFESLSEALVYNKQLLLLRLHPNEAELAKDISHYPNIINISDWQDTYEIINEVDLLITDYSSLYIDMLQTRADIVFFQFDHQQYQADSRQCYPYAENLPMAGEVIFEFDALLSYLHVMAESPNIASLTHKKNRAELTQLYWQYQHIESFTVLDNLVSQS
ncbi:CDP-glycerol glycerophosphotransferase family protein [Shewanella sp. MMG014]|uniref:CDP-glycerol glycerophosphotransferase family protein n=1 Tax=Shewanella sp. MMG014 TaxID=2822691 RepID=UPI001B36EEB6|nr:CDP-glycerol glycerophosphotransferase family protein [Shewanella sp. MMG014]MBQ4888462.1 CDP-glycerol glycerophosphotransferase family protein [Shewanella sp. MMG014]